MADLTSLLLDTFCQPAFLCIVLPGVWFCEWYLGVQNPHSRLTQNIRSLDMLWFLISPFLQWMFVLMPILGIHSLLDQWGFKSTNVEWLWLPVRFLIGFLFFDFLLWFSHWIRHAIPLFWRFHKVHHDNPKLGFFGAYRLHPIDLLVYGVLLSLPLFFFSGFFAPVLPYLVVVQWYTAFTHSSVVTNLSWLSRILVTPNSHRIHHDECSANKNYGFVFSIWDRIFQTHSDHAVGNAINSHERNNEDFQLQIVADKSFASQLCAPFTEILAKKS